MHRPGVILVVDDEPAVRRMAAAALASDRHRVLSAEGPEDARRAIESGDAPVDVVVTDLWMPHDGRTLIAWLGGHCPAVPVIATSARLSDAPIDHPELLRLAKPFRVAELRELVGRALRRRSLLRELQAEIERSPAHTCLLHGGARVRLANRAWDRFGRANGYRADGVCGVGLDYLEVCERARGDARGDAEAAARIVRAALAGEREAGHVYPCHARTEERWFRVTARPLRREPELFVCVEHERVAPA